MFDVVVEPYNATLSGHQVVEHSDATSVVLFFLTIGFLLISFLFLSPSADSAAIFVLPSWIEVVEGYHVSCCSSFQSHILKIYVLI